MKPTKLLLLLLFLPALCFSQGRDNRLGAKIKRDLYNPDGDMLMTKKDSADLKAKLTYVATINSLTALVRGDVMGVMVRDKVRGGLFTWEPTSSISPDGGYVFAAVGGGYWVRQGITDRINFAHYAGVGDYNISTNTGTDYSALLATATATAEALGKAIFVPAGHWGLAQYGIRNVPFLGEGLQKTYFHALSSTKPGCFYLADAPVQNINIRGFALLGGHRNANQHGLYLKAIPQPIPAYTGGLWYSYLEDIKVEGFKGHEIHSEAIDTLGGDLANQFLTLRNVQAYRDTTLTSRAFYHKGQMGQFMAINCQFDAQSRSRGTNVQLGDGHSEDIFQGTFVECTFQDSEYGIVARSVSPVLISCWFENLSKSITLQGNASISGERNHFANAADGSLFAGVGAGNGYLIDNCSSSGTLSGQYLGTTDRTGISSCNNTYYNDFPGLRPYFGNNTAPPTEGLTQQVGVNSDGSLSLFGNREILLNLSQTIPITTISSNLSHSDEIAITAFDAAGTNAYGTILNTGNIQLPPGTSRLILRGKDIVQLRKRDKIGSWYVKSVYQPRYATAIPTSGTFLQGETYYNSSPTATSPLSWVCTTAGSPGTWTPQYALNASSNNVASRGGGTIQMGIGSDGSLAIGNTTDVLLNTSPTSLSSITTSLSTGDVFTLRGWAGVGNTVKIITGGNITLAPYMNGSLTLNINEVAVFRVSNLAGSIVLIGTTANQVGFGATTTFTTDGTTTEFVVTHNLGYVPTVTLANQVGSASAGVIYVKSKTTTTTTYASSVAPPSGSIQLSTTNR